MVDTEYSFSAHVGSSGYASLDVNIKGPKAEEDKEKILATTLMNVTNFMMEQGYIDFLSASDIANKYCSTRQYWEKLIKEGKIPYRQTSAGKITTNLWVDGYLRDRNKGKYINAMEKIRSKILKLHASNPGQSDGIIECELCGHKNFHYNYNQGNDINGICRQPGCDLQLCTQKD